MCVEPPLTEVPEGAWECSECTVKIFTDKIFHKGLQIKNETNFEAP